MDYIYSLLSILISTGLLYVGLSFLLKKKLRSGNQDILKKQNDVEIIHNELERISNFVSGYASPLQLKSLEEQKTAVKAAFEELQATLISLQERIVKAKDSVRTREETQRLQKTLGEEQYEKIAQFEAAFQVDEFERRIALPQTIAVTVFQSRTNDK